MSEDPSSPSASDTNPSSSAETPNRPEPTVETTPSASESANLSVEAEAETQPQPTPESANTATGSASVATEQPQTEPAPTPETVVPSQSQQPEGEAVTQSTPPVSEPQTVPPAQEKPTPEIDQEKQENQEQQATTEPQSKPESEVPQPPQAAPSPPSTPSIPSLHFPFYGSSPVTFDFGAQPTEERIKKKYEEWGIVGHNGIDFGLQEGTKVLACDEGTVIQAGDNGDHGISVTIKHLWGTSIYAHLQSLGVLVNDTVKKAQVIGASGQTGFTIGPHLHFGIQPNSPDTNNGYLGYINPTAYLSEQSEKLQSQPQEEKSSDLSGDLSEEKPVEQAPAVPAEQPIIQSEPQSPISPQSPQQETTQPDIQQQVEAMFDARLKENSIKGNQVKKEKRDEAIQKIYSFAQEKKRLTNKQVRDLLHISQSTATDYLSDLVNRGMLKVEGKGRATIYVF